MWPQWITAIATAGGAVLVVAQLTRAVRQAHQRGQTQRRENTITVYLNTLDSRSQIKGDELPDDRDTEAICEFIETLLEAERDGREREPEIAKGRRALTQYLSFWEAVALGVRQDVFDFETLELQAASHVIALWANYEPWISAREEKYGKPLYEHLQWLAEGFERGHRLEDD
jgi:hypothetical protein